VHLNFHQPRKELLAKIITANLNIWRELAKESSFTSTFGGH